MDELCPDRLDIEKLTGSEEEISLFENGEKTWYKQAIHTLDAAKIAEGKLSLSHILARNSVRFTFFYPISNSLSDTRINASGKERNQNKLRLSLSVSFPELVCGLFESFSNFLCEVIVPSISTPQSPSPPSWTFVSMPALVMCSYKKTGCRVCPCRRTYKESCWEGDYRSKNYIRIKIDFFFSKYNVLCTIVKCTNNVLCMERNIIEI